MTDVPGRDLLPEPFRSERYLLRRHGIHDDAEVDVFVNEREDFAFLSPRPSFDYEHYQPRSKRLSLEAYRSRNDVIERRFEKVARWFGDGVHDVLEIGASDGEFLARLHSSFPQLSLVAVEPDQSTTEARQGVPDVVLHRDLTEVEARGEQFDRICFFHVLEHIDDPVTFLDGCRRVLRPGGKLVIEVPSLEDPLLSVYGSVAYEAFFFQAQHPFVYSAGSVRRLLEANGFAVEDLVHHQRYGLENHLTWLARECPGGDTALREMFGSADDHYRRCLEAAGRADAVVLLASLRTGQASSVGT